MVDKKPKKPMGRPSKGGRARQRGEARPLNIEITPAMDDAVEACRQAKRWTKRVLVEVALEQLLSAEGFWPWPKDPPAEAE